MTRIVFLDTETTGLSDARPDVPGDLVALIVPILREPCPRCGDTTTPTGDIVTCPTCMDSGSIGPIYSRREVEDCARAILAAVRPLELNR